MSSSQADGLAVVRRISQHGPRTSLNTEHFITSADVSFTVYSAGQSTPWPSSQATIYLIYIRLMLHFLFLITLYI
jgi:hypothetical protein